MRKICPLFVYMMLLMPQVFAQRQLEQQPKEKQKPKLSLSLSGGASFPLQDFIVTFPNPVKSEEPGCARTGESADIFFKISDIPKLTSHISFGLLCGYNYNSFDRNSYMQYERFFHFATQNVPPSGYQMLRILPALIFSFGKKLTFNFRITGGVLFLKTPIMSYQMGFVYTNQIESQNGTNLAYDFGIGLKYPLSPKIFLLLNADYFRSTPEVSMDYFFKISEISTTLGVEYTF